MENKEARIESVPFDGGRRIHASTYTPTLYPCRVIRFGVDGQPPRDEEKSIRD